MKHWQPTEVVDGAGLTVDQHAVAIASSLQLSENQTAMLVAELRNALVPGSITGSSAKGVERILFLADALAKRYQ